MTRTGRANAVLAMPGDGQPAAAAAGCGSLSAGGGRRQAAPEGPAGTRACCGGGGIGGKTAASRRCDQARFARGSAAQPPLTSRRDTQVAHHGQKTSTPCKMKTMDVKCDVASVVPHRTRRENVTCWNVRRTGRGSGNRVQPRTSALLEKIHLHAPSTSTFHRTHSSRGRSSGVSPLGVAPRVKSRCTGENKGTEREQGRSAGTVRRWPRVATVRGNLRAGGRPTRRMFRSIRSEWDTIEPAIRVTHCTVPSAPKISCCSMSGYDWIANHQQDENSSC